MPLPQDLRYIGLSRFGVLQIRAEPPLIARWIYLSPLIITPCGYISMTLVLVYDRAWPQLILTTAALVVLDTLWLVFAYVFFNLRRSEKQPAIKGF